MLTKQGGKLEQSLIDGGVSPLAANDAMAAVANCAQPLGHRGPVSFDYTNPEFRFVTPPLRKWNFPNLDDIRIPRKKVQPPPTQKKKYDPPEFEPQSPRPQFQPARTGDDGSGYGGGVIAGPFIRVSDAGRSAVVSANVYGGAQQVAIIGGNSLNGMSMEIDSSEPQALRATKTGSVKFRLQPVGRFGKIVTGIDIDDTHLKVTTCRAYILAAGEAEEEDIALTKIEYVEDVVTGANLTFKRREAYVLAGQDRVGTDINIPIADCTV